jgi:hypothetical protein
MDSDDGGKATPDASDSGTDEKMNIEDNITGQAKRVEVCIDIIYIYIYTTSAPPIPPTSFGSDAHVLFLSEKQPSSTYPY